MSYVKALKETSRPCR